MNNIQIPNYKTYGSGDKTVFLLHGAYGDGRYFDDLATKLAAAHYRVVVWDCPGYGQSEPAPSPTIECFADAAQALIEKEKTSVNILLGHSMGALISPLVASRTSFLSAVILSAGSAGFMSRTPEDQARYLKERLEPIENGMSVAEYARPLIAHMMAPGAKGVLVDQVAEVILSMKTETFANSIRAISSYDSRPALQKIPVPTLLIAGAKDTACTAEGMRKMAEMVPDSEFHVIDGAGHYGFAERPREYFTIVLGFLNSHFG